MKKIIWIIVLFILPQIVGATVWSSSLPSGSWCFCSTSASPLYCSAYSGSVSFTPSSTVIATISPYGCTRSCYGSCGQTCGYPSSQSYTYANAKITGPGGFIKTVWCHQESGNSGGTQTVTLTGGQTYTLSSAYICEGDCAHTGFAKLGIQVSYTDPCTPATCSSLGKNCGSWSNNCGGTLNCGSCSAGYTCTNGVCTLACTPATCSSLGKNCGSWSNNCGGTLNCGSCGAGKVCNNGVCCTPSTCSSLGKNCGSWSNNCGGTLNCGSCGAGQACISGVCTATTFSLTVTKSGTGSGTVSSSPAGINSCGGTCSYSFNSGASVTLTAAPTSTSSFTGWSGSCSGTLTTCTVSMTAARSVTATFSPMHYLSILKSGTGSGTVTSASSPTQTNQINCGLSCSVAFSSGTSVTLTAAPTSTSSFTGWSGSCSGTLTTCTVPMDMAKTVTATFVPKYSLSLLKSDAVAATITSNPAGISCGTACSSTSANFNSGASVVLSGILTAGYEIIDAVGCDSETSTTCTVLMNTPKSVTITFIRTYLLTVSRGGTGSGTVTSASSPTQTNQINCGSACSVTFYSGMSVTLTAASNPGSYFSGWSGGVCSGTLTTCTVPMTVARSVTATFMPLYNLTVTKSGTGSGTVSGSGIDCDPTCVSTFNSGASVTLTAASNPGSYFSGWSGGVCSGTLTTCSFLMNGPKPVTATFMPKYNLTVTKSGTGSGNVTSSPLGIRCDPTCLSTFNSSTAITLTATPSPGSYFSGWSGGVCSGTLTTCPFSMNAEKLVTATFMPKYNLTVSKIGTASASTITSNLSGINCGSTCSSIYNFGTSIKLIAGTLTAGYTITWTNGCDSINGNNCTVLLNSNKTINVTLSQFNCNSPSPSGTGMLIYPGTPSQVNQNWIYDDTSPYSNCSWRCDSANGYVRDGTTQSCIIPSIPTEDCTNSIDDDSDGKVDWADSDCPIQVIKLFILDGWVIR